MKLNTIYQGDCLETLNNFPSGSIDCCVTSPPYWGLRDYQTATWDGGDMDCDHKEYLGGHGEKSAMQVNSKGTQTYSYKDVCKKCGAIRTDSQLGLEKTPEEYVSNMVAVFREVKRVLKPEGTLWLNLGDTYWGGGWRGDVLNEHSGDVQKNHIGTHCGQTMTMGKGKNNTYKSKDLVGIPWMTAFALRSDGWYLRQDIIWAKPNPMPESVTDRCTKSHEYIFLMSKSQKYYYDYEAIMDKSVDPESYKGRRKRGVPSDAKIASDTHGANNWDKIDEGKTYEMRNKRSVWTVNTRPYKESHFATFPPKLIVDCIKAGCPAGGIVLDPFMGAGTTAMVARKLDRNFVGVELNPEYVKLANRRLYKEMGLFL